MARIVCMTSGLRGLLNASFEVVARLTADGHRVTFACPHDVGDLVRAQGIEYCQLAPVNFDPSAAPPGGRLLARFTAAASAARRRRAAVGALGMEAFRKVIEELAPDLVLIDTEMYEHVFTLWAMGVPTLGLTPFFAQYPDAGRPPLAIDATPADTDASVQHRRRRAQQIKAVTARYHGTERRSVLLAYAQSLGYPVDALEQVGALTLFVDTRLPTLLLTARELDFPGTLPAHAHYVGPMVAAARSEDDVSASDLDRLDALLTQPREGPLLYYPRTTMATGDAGLAQRLAAAVSMHPEWTLILAGAPDFESDAPNVHAFGHLPQIRVLAHADLCVTMAGMNTVHEALAAGVALLGYPHGFDQPGVAARLRAAGLMRVGRAADTATDIARRIGEVLADTALADQSARMTAVLASYRDKRVLESVVRTTLDNVRD